jgi:hypothetical protein
LILANVTTPSHDSVRAIRPPGFLWRIAITAALGGLLFGYDRVVIGGAKHFYETYFSIDSDWLIGWANSCACLSAWVVRCSRDG